MRRIYKLILLIISVSVLSLGLVNCGGGGPDHVMDISSGTCYYDGKRCSQNNKCTATGSNAYSCGSCKFYQTSSSTVTAYCGTDTLLIN
jgi:hypothetical protein